VAYIISQVVEGSEAAIATYTPDLTALDYTTGDLILLCITQDNGGTTIATATSGWNIVGTQSANGGSRQVWAYKVAASSSETDPEFTGTNDDWVVQMFVVRGADTSTPIHASARGDWNAAEEVDSPALTTTNDDCLLFYSFGSDNVTEMVLDTNVAIPLIYNFNVGVCAITGYRQQFSAGAVPTVKMTHEVNGEGGNAWVIAINNASGGSRDIAVNQTIDVVNYLGSLLSTTAAIATAADSVTGLTAINGITMSSVLAALGDTQVRPGVPWGNVTGFTCSEDTVFQGAFLGISIDLSDKALGFYASVSNITSTRVDTEGLISVVVDSSDNWKAVQLASRSSMVSNQEFDFVLDFGIAPTYDESASPVDLTDVVKIGFFIHRRTASNAIFYIANLVILTECSVVGGSEARPFVSTDLNRILNANRFYLLAQTQGSGQALIKQSLQLGDGTAPTYVQLAANSIEVARPKSSYLVSDNHANIEIYGSADCVFDLSGCILATTQENKIIINASSNASGSYDFTGAVLKGWSIENNVSGISINDASILDGKGITLNGGRLARCLITSEQVTTTTCDIEDCAFTSVGSGHAIEITATGTHDFFGNTFTGYGADSSTDAAIYNNSGGLVTLTLGDGDPTPTIRNGAGASTTISAPAAGYTLALPNIIDGSRYQIYNVTADAELDNAVVSGGSGITHTYDEGVDFTIGDIGRYRVAYQSGTTAKQTLEGEFTFTGGTTTNSLPVTQVNQAEYNSYGVDGSGISEFAWDSGNIQIDIDDADNTTVIQRIAAWYYYFITTATGIDEAFGAITWLALNQVRINTSVVSVTLDNTKSTPLLLSGGRLFRSDGSTIIASASNSIQLDYDPVYIAETGTSGLTTAEAAQLAEIANVKAKTDNLPSDPAKEASVKLAIGLSA